MRRRVRPDVRPAGVVGGRVRDSIYLTAPLPGIPKDPGRAAAGGTRQCGI
jgi:hypothetical protein